MRRREFIALLGSGVAGWALAARAQQAMPVVGIITARSAEGSAQFGAAFRRGLERFMSKRMGAGGLLRRDDACCPRHQYPELRECDRNYDSDRYVGLGCQRDGWRSAAMSQQEGNTSENQCAPTR